MAASILEKIIQKLPGVEILEKIQEYSNILENYKDKWVRITLKNGDLVKAKFVKRVLVPEGFKFKKENGEELIIPHDSVFTYEILESKQSLKVQLADEFQKNTRWTFQNLPNPFISPEGNFDVIVSFGAGKRDLDEYQSFTEMTEDPVQLVDIRCGRRGDFDYLLKLFSILGYICKEKRTALDKPNFPVGRQSFLMTDSEKKTHNIIAVGSGSVNSTTREIFAFYRDALPIRFEIPESDIIISEIGGIKRRYDARIKEDQHVGLIEMVPSPYNPDKVVLIVAGLRYTGTQAAIIALTQGFLGSLPNTRIQIKGKMVNVPVTLVKGVNIEYRHGIAIVNDFVLLNQS